VYAIFNLNVVSWGTREVTPKKSKMVRHFLWLSLSLSQRSIFKILLSGSQKLVPVFCKKGLLQPTTTPFYEIKPVPSFHPNL
jgi:hypothetical protein